MYQPSQQLNHKYFVKAQDKISLMYLEGPSIHKYPS